MQFGKIKFADADRTQLRQFAEFELGLSVPDNATVAQIRAKVVEHFKAQGQTVGDTTEITAVIGQASAPQGVDAPPPAPQPVEVALAAAPVDQAPAAAPAVDAAPGAKPDLYDTAFVEVFINETEEFGNSRAGKEPVFLSVNGSAIWVERNKTQRIKLKYVEVLEHAEKIVYTYDDKLDEISSRRVPAYPFQLQGLDPRPHKTRAA